MSTRIKGIFKGIRFISQIFDDEQQKEQDIQIGLPTDVKHVAHAGWDGQPIDDVADKPSWMRDLGDSQPNKDNASEGDGPKSSRRRSTDNTSPKKPSRRLSADNATAKPRQSRRAQPKDSSDTGGVSDLPKKTRRKKPDSVEGGPWRPKSKAAGDAEADNISFQLNADDEKRENVC